MKRIALGLAATALSAASFHPAGAGPGYTRTDAFVLMSDLTPIDVSLYVPDALAPAGGRPLIVRQHGGGSNKDNAYDTTYALRAIPRGFAVLMYSARGHGRSGGIFDFFGQRSVMDFSEILDWVGANHSTVDTSRVGVSGYSQGGGMSLLPAESDARVRAVAVGNTFDDLNHALNPGDCFKFSFATGIFVGAYKATGSRTDDTLAAKWGASFYSDTEDVSAGPVPSTWSDLHGRSPLSSVDRLVARRVPVFWSNSWEDQLFPADHPDQMLLALRNAGVPVHSWYASGGHAAGPNDPTDETAKEAAMLDWFDEFLRGADHGFTTGPDMHYAQRVPGTASGWTIKTAIVWPAFTFAPLFVGPDGTLGSAADPSFSDTVENDFANTNVRNDAITNEVARNVPGLGDVVQSIPEDGTERDTRTYVSAPLAGPVEATGAPVVQLDVVSTTAQRVMQVAAKVWDVAPDGSATLVNRGCRSEAPSFFTDYGDVTLWPNTHVFPAGHRIALSVAAVDFPTFEADKEPATTTFTGESFVLLPVVSGSLPA